MIRNTIGYFCITGQNVLITFVIPIYHFNGAEPTNNVVIKTTEHFAYSFRKSVDLLIYYYSNKSVNLQYTVPFDISITIYSIDVHDFENIYFLIM